MNTTVTAVCPNQRTWCIKEAIQWNYNTFLQYKMNTIEWSSSLPKNKELYPIPCYERISYDNLLQIGAKYNEYNSAKIQPEEYFIINPLTSS